MEDKEMNCSWKLEDGKPCDEPFIWTEQDQKFYAEKGYTPPKYCGFHRAERKRRQAERESAS